MNSNNTLVRLMDWKNENMIAAFYTENGVDFLKQYTFCKENDIAIDIPNNWDLEEGEYNPYKNKEAGAIEETSEAVGPKSEVEEEHGKVSLLPAAEEVHKNVEQDELQQVIREVSKIYA